MKNKIIFVLFVILLAVKWLGIVPSQSQSHHQKPSASSQTTHNTPLQTAYQNRQSNVQVAGTGTVSKILPDDNQGSRHQRFILRLDNGQTILVAHNIDLAPKIANLQTGDSIDFYGEYEYNEQGGVLHWTHHDPSKNHTDGWLKHQNRLYQ